MDIQNSVHKTTELPSFSFPFVGEFFLAGAGVVDGAFFFAATAGTFFFIPGAAGAAGATVAGVFFFMAGAAG